MSIVGRALNLIGRDSSTPVPYSASSTLQIPMLQGAGAERNMATYGHVGTIFSIVNKLANTTAQTWWQLVVREPGKDLGDERISVDSHAMIDLVDNPNNFYDRATFMEAGQQHVDLTGEGWVILDFDPRAPTLPLSMWIVRPDRMTPVPHPTQFIAGYVYTAPNGEKIPFERHEVRRLMMPNPLDPYRGIGPVQSILTAADSMKYSAEWNRNFFLNSAEPGGIIEVPTALSDPQFDQLRTRWNEQHRGVRKAHRVAILEHGKWVPVGYSMRDMQFSELRKATRDEIMEAFAIHKQALGISEDVNRANALAGEASFGRWQSIPRLNRWKALFDGILWEFYDPQRRYEWIYANPVPPDREDERAELTAKVDALCKLLDQGVRIEQACEVVGLPPMEQAGSDGGLLTPQQVGDMIQSIYLGVGKVVTWEEARTILVAAGIPLDLSVPQPAPAVAVPPPEPATADGKAEARALTPPARASATEQLAHRNRRRADAPRVLNLAAEDLPDLPDLTPVEDSHAEALAALLASWSAITDDWRDELVGQIEDAINDGQLDALLTMTVDTAHATVELEVALAAIAATAADQMAEEAKTAGTTIDPLTPDPEVLDEMAWLTAGLLASGYALSAGKEAARVYRPGATGREVSDAVNAFLKTLTDAQPAEQLGGALHGAQNAARLETLAAAPKTAVYATEVMDKATCSPCRKIDGTWLGYNNSSADMKAIRATYPNGGYTDCEGRARCRGTVVGLWA